MSGVMRVSGWQDARTPPQPLTRNLPRAGPESDRASGRTQASSWPVCDLLLQFFLLRFTPSLLIDTVDEHRKYRLPDSSRKNSYINIQVMLYLFDILAITRCAIASSCRKICWLWTFADWIDFALSAYSTAQSYIDTSLFSYTIIINFWVSLVTNNNKERGRLISNIRQSCLSFCTDLLVHNTKYSMSNI